MISNILKSVESQVIFRIQLVFWRISSRSYFTYDFRVAILVQLFSKLAREKLRKFLHVNCKSLDSTWFICNTLKIVESHVLFRFGWFFDDFSGVVFVPKTFNCFTGLLSLLTCSAKTKFSIEVFCISGEGTWRFLNTLNLAECQAIFRFQLIFWRNCSRSYCTYDFPVAIFVQLF